MEAMMSLDAVTACTTVPRVLSDVHFVRQRLNSPTRSARGAADALAKTTRGLRDCLHARVRAKLADAKRAVRDVVVSRVQLCVPFGDRDMFMDKLASVFVGEKYDYVLCSQLLHSYKRTFSGIPGQFQSNTSLVGRTSRRANGGNSSQSDKATAEASTHAPTDTSSDVGDSALSHARNHVPSAPAMKYSVNYYIVRPVMFMHNQPGWAGECPYTSVVDFRRAA